MPRVQCERDRLGDSGRESAESIQICAVVRRSGIDTKVSRAVRDPNLNAGSLGAGVGEIERDRVFRQIGAVVGPRLNDGGPLETRRKEAAATRVGRDLHLVAAATISDQSRIRGSGEIAGGAVGIKVVADDGDSGRRTGWEQGEKQGDQDDRMSVFYWF